MCLFFYPENHTKCVQIFFHALNFYMQRPNEFCSDVVASQLTAMQLAALGNTFGHGYHFSYAMSEFITKYVNVQFNVFPVLSVSFPLSLAYHCRII